MVKLLTPLVSARSCVATLRRWMDGNPEELSLGYVQEILAALRQRHSEDNVSWAEAFELPMQDACRELNDMGVRMHNLASGT